MSALVQIPEIAKSAVALLQEQFNGKVNQLAVQTLAVMQLNPADGWRVDFPAGTITRPEVPKLALVRDEVAVQPS